MTKSYSVTKKHNSTAFVDTILDTWDMVCDSLRCEKKKKSSKDNSTIILGEICTNVVCRELRKKNTCCQTENTDGSVSCHDPKTVKIKKTQGKILEVRRGRVPEDKAYKELAKTLQKLAKGQEKECLNVAVKELMKRSEEVLRQQGEANDLKCKTDNQPPCLKDGKERKTGQKDNVPSATSLASCPTCNGRGKVEQRDSCTQYEKRERRWPGKVSSSEGLYDWSNTDFSAQCPSSYGAQQSNHSPDDCWESYEAYGVAQTPQNPEDYMTTKQTCLRGSWERDNRTRQPYKQFEPPKSYRSLSPSRPMEANPVGENSTFKDCPGIPSCSHSNEKPSPYCLCCWWHMKESQKWPQSGR